MPIFVVNKRNSLPNDGIIIPIDRSSVLGNPFVMTNENQRDLVCDKYKVWLDTQVNKKNAGICNQLNVIYSFTKKGINVYLACWCAPKRCHGDYITELIRSKG